YLTGMRRGDILNLKLVDIDDKKGIYNQQGKTGKKQLFTWTPALRAVIANAKRARKTRNLIYLFTNTHGQQITETGFNSTWRRIRVKANITDVTFHDLRGKAITDANEKGGLDYAKALGGHENRDMTERYIKSKSVEEIEPVK
ncbi:MAG: tyrosine-type recombinase/integrase, partial [Gammaproteobacteria bacterium]|nr:tyrosine-type recombinase/integrase [Gammaproteobacteria bacterium]